MGVLPGVPARGADGRCEHGNCLHQSDSAPQMPGKLTRKKTTSVVFFCWDSSTENCSWHPTISCVRSYPNPRQGIFDTSFQMTYIPYDKRTSNRNSAHERRASYGLSLLAEGAKYWKFFCCRFTMFDPPQVRQHQCLLSFLLLFSSLSTVFSV